jgi:N-acetylglucosamine-6-phosphate deacetylase
MLETRTLRGQLVCADGLSLSGRVTFSERIEAVEPALPAGDDQIVPGLIDLQVNGVGSHDVMAASPGEIAAIARSLAAEGVTAFLPTAITAPLDRLERVHDAVCQAAVMLEHEAAQAAIVGLHLEGPFISPARLGIHPRFNLEPRGEALERVLAMEQLRMVTLAAELAGAREAINRLAARGVVSAIGHSDATLEEAMEAVSAGARMFTHLFNAMRPIHHRAPGVAVAGLLPSAALAALIADGAHVHPAMLRLAFRARGHQGLILTSDRVATPSDSGKERLTASGADAMGGFERMRGMGAREGAARCDSGVLAGSFTSLLDAVRLMIQVTGASLSQAVAMAAENPARLMRLSQQGTIAVGARADLLVLDRDLNLKAVFIGGREVA